MMNELHWNAVFSLNPNGSLSKNQYHAQKIERFFSRFKLPLQNSYNFSF
jgi:hypothetical protein